ncbi:response regulator transcription factor [Tindallia californiensis]|uniref:Stage 0 sporulation protein A homolog n=1 Tax=Tindallia californiensis TaxID=159292 RepID=A0A1H3PUE3_9FIRM|nr:response regulator transcription factor [Tindallia californiensis]SDZ04737.1 DNA-binding response regulator, OmpR family, contains REC and winged-helix (wHTH) domain [Tindallia californiensis]
MHNPSVLVIEDEEKLRKLVATYFKRENYQVFEAADGVEGVTLFEDHPMDLVILDIMMPGYDGWTVCRRIREESQVPVILLTARSEENDKLFGFELGADDYMTKPFSVKELMARSKALLKRSGVVSEEKQYQIGELWVDTDRHHVEVKGKVIDLTPKEYELLLLFLKNSNQAMERETILNKVWGYDYYGDDRTVDTHVKRLRHKLGDVSQRIRTLRGVGYIFEVTKE